jgi:hypothetical protein
MFPARLGPMGKQPPPAEVLPPDLMGQCDADAKGSEDALIRLAGPGGRTLSYCLHHFREHELAMAAAGWQVIWDSRRDPELAPPPP